jgi:hypothetical protein
MLLAPCALLSDWELTLPAEDVAFLAHRISARSDIRHDCHQCKPEEGRRSCHCGALRSPSV